jgi:hypothetical protein
MSTKLILENLFRIRKVVDDIIEGSITLDDEQVEKFFWNKRGFFEQQACVGTFENEVRNLQNCRKFTLF